MRRFSVIIPWILQTLSWIPTRLALKILYDLKVKGLENLNGVGPGVIFVSNHVSELDPILIPASLPFLSRFMPMFYTCREKEYYRDKKFGWKRYIYGGLFFEMWGAYEVLVGVNNYELALKNHLEILKNGQSVCIFPEGRKNPEGKYIEPKGGVSYLAQKTNALVIPVGITGAIKKEKIIVNFGKPIDSRELFPDQGFQNVDSYKEAAKMIMQKVNRLEKLG